LIEVSGGWLQHSAAVVLGGGGASYASLLPAPPLVFTDWGKKLFLNFFKYFTKGFFYYDC
jgi:hypothetical protein